MSTQKHRVAAYLPRHLEDAFNKYKRTHHIGDSAALIQILETFFFGVSNAELIRGEGAIERLLSLEAKVAILIAYISENHEKDKTDP